MKTGNSLLVTIQLCILLVSASRTAAQLPVTETAPEKIKTNALVNNEVAVEMKAVTDLRRLGIQFLSGSQTDLSETQPEENWIVPPARGSKRLYASMPFGDSTSRVNFVVDLLNNREYVMRITFDDDVDFSNKDDLHSSSRDPVEFTIAYRDGSSQRYAASFRYSAFPSQRSGPPQMRNFPKSLRLGRAQVEGKNYTIAVADSSVDGLYSDLTIGESVTYIDLNGDGRFDIRKELFPGGSSFKIGDEYYRVARMTPSGNQLTLSSSPFGHLYGRILDQRSGRPLANAKIQIAEFAGSTDAQGQYRLRVPAGIFDTVIAKADGYVPHLKRLRDDVHESKSFEYVIQMLPIDISNLSGQQTLKKNTTHHFLSNRGLTRSEGFSEPNRNFVGDLNVRSSNEGMTFNTLSFSQRSIADLGDLGDTPFDQITERNQAYKKNGVKAVVGHTYVVLTNQGELGNHVIFRVKEITNDSVMVDYQYRDAGTVESDTTQAKPASRPRKQTSLPPSSGTETWAERLSRQITVVEPGKVDLHAIQVSSLPRDVFGRGKRLDEGHTSDWLVGSGTAIFGSFTVDEQSAFDYQKKQSYLERFTDDQGTDLTASPGTQRLSTTFEMNRPLSVSVSNDKRTVGFTFRGYQIPARDASRLSASAKLFFRSFTDLKTEEKSNVKFDYGETFRVGPVSFAVQDPQTIPRNVARTQRGASFEELNNPKSQLAFTLIVDRRPKPLVSIELLDAKGNVIRFDEEQTGLRSEGHFSGPRAEGDRLVWMIRKTLTPPTSIRVKWYEKAEMIQVPVDIDTYLGLGKAPPVEFAEPTSRLAGVVDGKPFHPDVVEYKNHSLVFRKFGDQISFSLFFWSELLKDGAQLRGGEGGSGGPSWIIVKSAGDTDHVRENFALALDITRYSERLVEGTLDLKIQGRDVHLSGPFSVARAKKPTDPLDKGDVPFVTGRARVVGRTGGSTVGADFVGMGMKGNRLRGYSQHLQHGSSAAWTDQNAPQVSSIRQDGDDHVTFQHAKLEPGDYLFSIEVGSRELMSSRPMAWVRRTVSDGDQIHLQMDVDLTKLGSVDVTVPKSTAEAFQTYYDRVMEHQQRTSSSLGTTKPILPLYLNPRELDGEKLIARENPFNWGGLDPGQTTIKVDNVPPGTYIARCGRSHAEVTVVSGKKVSVTLVNEDASNE